MSHRISIGMGGLEVDVPLSIPWWEKLKERNKSAEAKYIPLRSFKYVPKDPCPLCGADFVHVVLMDIKHSCRKCGGTFEFRG